MGKLAVIFNLMRVGHVVNNPALWKKGGITVTMLAPVVVAVVHLLNAFGISIDVTDEQAATLAGAVVIVVNLVLPVVTSEDIGVR